MSTLPLDDRPCPAQTILRIPVIRGRGRDLLHVVHARHPLAFNRAAHGLFHRDVFGGQNSLHRPLVPQMTGQSPGVDSLDARDVPRLKILVEAAGGAPATHHRTELLDDKTAHVGLAALLVERIDPVVPNLRIGHGHDLTPIRGIREHLLVTGHRCVETHLSDRGANGTKAFSDKITAVFKGKDCAHAGRE